MSDIPEAAVEAAAEAIRDNRWTRDHKYDADLARAAIEAAMPAIREHIAQEIEASPEHSMLPTRPSRAYGMGLTNAARIVRGGTP